MRQPAYSARQGVLYPSRVSLRRSEDDNPTPWDGEMTLFFLGEKVLFGDDAFLEASFESGAGVACDLATSHRVGFEFGIAFGVFGSMDFGGCALAKHGEDEFEIVHVVTVNP